MEAIDKLRQLLPFAATRQTFPCRGDCDGDVDAKFVHASELSRSKGEMCPAMTLLCKDMRVAVQSSRYTSALRLAACLSIVTLTACDPIVTIAGANFPSWLLCMIVGAILATIVRPLFVLARLESYLGPLTIFYPSLIAMFGMISS